MAKPLVSDALWRRVQAVLPTAPPKPKGGRPRVPDRAYDHEDQVRQPLWPHGLTAFIAPRGSPHGSGLGRIR